LTVIVSFTPPPLVAGGFEIELTARLGRAGFRAAFAVPGKATTSAIAPIPAASLGVVLTVPDYSKKGRRRTTEQKMSLRRRRNDRRGGALTPGW